MLENQNKAITLKLKHKVPDDSTKEHEKLKDLFNIQKKKTVNFKVPRKDIKKKK